MSWTVILAVVLGGTAVGLAAWAVAHSLDPVRRLSKINLYRDMTSTHPEAHAAAVTTAAQTTTSLTQLAYKLTPDLVVRVLERQLILAGRPAAWPLHKLLVFKVGWAVAALIGIALVLVSAPTPLVAVICLFVAVAGYFLPELLAYNTAQKRGEQIQIELADTLDQMTIAVEAGLGFDGAMARAGENGRGPLAEELVRTLQDIRMGNSRQDAFRALSERTEVTDLRRFVRAVIQADTYGVSVAGVLRTQADEMRLKRRQRAEEKAQKIPVKVLGPLMIFILPVLFIVVMGPAVMSMMDTLGGL